MTREIDDLDFNSLRTKILEVLGTGSGTYGYGQEIKSSQVFQGNIITKSQWDGLRADLINILVHQTGLTPDVIEIVKGDIVGESNPLLEFNDLIEQAKTNRFDLDSSQSTVTAVTTKTYTSPWNTSATSTFKLTFSSENNARFFFNSGGKLRISSSRSGGNSTAQNGAWTNVLQNAGNIEFGGNTSRLNFYGLTNSYQTLYEVGLTTPYSANVYKIEVLSNVSNNAAGNATEITFKITWEDNYSESFPNTVVSPPDQVDGTLSYTVEEIKASGSLQPNGTFSIESPVYNINEITAGFEAAPPPPPRVYTESVSVPTSVNVGQTFSGSVTGGYPGSAFTVVWRNSGGTVVASGTSSLDGSGNYSSGAIGVFNTADTYRLTVSFDYTGNVITKFTTAISSPPPPPPPPPSCVNPPDTSDALAIYQTGMVLVYTNGLVSQGNTLVKTTKTYNASVVNSWYKSIIGRPGEPEGLNYWTGRLNAGEVTITVFLAFTAAANSGEIAANGKVRSVYTYCGYNG